MDSMGKIKQHYITKCQLKATRNQMSTPILPELRISAKFSEKKAATCPETCLAFLKSESWTLLCHHIQIIL